MRVFPRGERAQSKSNKQSKAREKLRRRLILCEALESRQLLSASMLQYHNDNASTGQNLTETQLTPSNVVTGSFGKRFSTATDGQAYAQPLYVSGLNVTGGVNPGVHNVVFVATEHDSLYAIDGDSGQILYQDSFINPANGITTVPSADVLSTNIDPEIGITGTPVIDAATNSLFVVAKTKQIVAGNTANPHYVMTLYKVNIQDGTFTSTVMGDTTHTSSGGYIYNSGPYTVGTGDGAITVNSQSRVYFNALREMDRPALALNGGQVFIAFGSHGDNGPYHGWILGYNETTLANTAAFNTTPNSGLAGIWQAGGTIAIDSSGFMYLETGNGGFDTTLNTQGMPNKGDYGDSFIKLAIDPTTTETSENVNGFGLKVVDYFTPSNQAALDSADKDLGSGAPMLLPDSVGSAAHPHLMIGTGKEGKIYLIDRDNMGKFSPVTDKVVQELGSAINGSVDTPAFYNDGTTSRIYYVGSYGDVARTFTIANGAIATTPSSVSPDSYGYPGSTPSISANGTTNGIVWDLDAGTNQVRAYDASSYANELWVSKGGDGLGSSLVKFTAPTVINGHVYVGTASALVAYGPPTPPTTIPNTPTGLTATAVSAVQISLAWTDNSNNEDGYFVQQSTDGGTTWTQIASLGVNANSYPVTNLMAGNSYSYRVYAHNVLGVSGFSNVASATTSSQLPAVNFASGFTGSAGALTFNGSAVLNGSALQLTDGAGSEAGSAFTTSTLPDQRFTTTFTLQLTNAQADGMTFTLQGSGNKALGGGGGGLGYAGITPSIGIKFDLYDNGGEGTDSTGLFTAGANPTINANTFDMTSSGVDLHGGDPLQVTLSYDGTNLNEMIFDTTTGSSFSHSYAIDIPGTIGAKTAYVGFTAGTGGATAIQDVLNWTYTPLPIAPPAVPTGLSVVAASGSQLNLTWTEPAGTTPDGFKILRATSASGPFAQVNEVAGNQTTYMDTQLSPDTTYYYEIVATNSAGDSQPSQSAGALLPLRPVTPLNAAATFVGTNELAITWVDASDNETGYKIFRKKSTQGDDQFAQIATLPANSTTYDDKAVQPGFEYDYHVQAYNIAGFSDFAGITLSTLAAAPTGVTATGGAGQVALNWTASNGATSYNIYRSTTPGGEGATPVQTGVTATSFTDTGLAGGANYYYQVSAVDPSGEGPLSAEVTGQTSTAPQMSAVQGNDGSAQRSMVSSLTLKFSEPVSLPAGAVTLALHAGQTGTVPTLSASSPDGGITWVISFSGAGVTHGSIADGVYDLTVHSGLVLDAASNAMTGGDQTFAFHRLFGDIDGNGTVNSADYFKFKAAFGAGTGSSLYNAAFDYDGNGTINSADYFKFKANFGMKFTY
jgi:fibronectin type 3 domain-containing protein